MKKLLFSLLLLSCFHCVAAEDGSRLWLRLPTDAGAEVAADTHSLPLRIARAWNQHRMKSGRTLWEGLCYTYDRGVQQTRNFQKVWDNAEKFVDSQRFGEVQRRLKIQARDAVWWRDGCPPYGFTK